MTEFIKRDLQGFSSEAEAELLQPFGHQGSRRDVLKRFAGAALVSAAGLPLFASAGLANAETPKRGGSIRVAGATASTTDTLDPSQGVSSTDYCRQYMFFNGLTTLNMSLAPEPALAESYASSDALTWVFKLRSGVTFHDGSSLSAEDVVYSLSRHKNPELGSKVLALARQMETIKATGPLEVTIVLSSANADLPVMLGTSHFLIVKNGAKDFSKPVGTGPFVCEAFEPGIRAVGVRNQNYWKSGQPYLDRIEVVGIVDNAARVNALLSGDVALIGTVPTTSAAQISSAPGFGVTETKAGNFNNIVMRINEKPGNNADFVEGVKYMMNRRVIMKAVYRDFAALANDNPIHPSSPYFNKDLPQREFDLDKARFYIKKSGLSGETFEVTASPASPSSEEIAQIWQQTASSAGLNLRIRRVPSDGYWSNEWMKRPITFGDTNSRPTPDLALTLYFKSDSNWNESGWKNEKFDQLLLVARGERDFDKRKQMYGDLQEIITKECSIAIPSFKSILDAHTTKLKGLKPIPLGNLMGFNFADSVWLDT